MHEKQLKGRDIAHSAGVGRKIAMAVPPVEFMGINLDPLENPFLTVRFLYRSKSMLQIYYGVGVFAD